VNHTNDHYDQSLRTPFAETDRQHADGKTDEALRDATGYACPLVRLQDDATSSLCVEKDITVEDTLGRGNYVCSRVAAQTTRSDHHLHSLVLLRERCKVSAILTKAGDRILIHSQRAADVIGT
jgi:hypothetical protein